MSICHPWHNIHTKSQEFPSGPYVVVKFVQTSIPCEEVSLGKVRLGYVIDAHAQMIMRNDVIVIPPHDFKHLSRCYCRVQKVKKLIFICHPWHNIHTKFNYFPSGHYLVMKFVQTSITCEEVNLGKVRSRGSSCSIVSWLRSGRSGDRGSIPDRGRGFFF
jgi:hypothetical protein